MNNLIAIIVEGQKYEKGVFNNLQQQVLRHVTNAIPKFLTLPASANLYMIWKEIAQDADIDIIEIIREKSIDAAKELRGFDRSDFSEIFLFFDYDAHQDNIPDTENAEAILKAMLSTFDNETENGKLYISYPMAEAIRDYKQNSCKAYSGNCLITYNVKNYKHISGDGNTMAKVTGYKKADWQAIILIYLNRVTRLFNKEMTIEKCKELTPEVIYEKQQSMISRCSQVVILSAFPEFLIEYFKTDVIYDFIGEQSIICSKQCYL